MIQRNKYLITFVLLLNLIGVYIVTQSPKIIHLLIQHTTYYCQALLANAAIKIPHIAGIFIIAVIGFLVMNACMKLLIAYSHVKKVKKQLTIKVNLSKRMITILERYGLEKKVILIQNSIPFAFCYGIRNPKIYISTKTISLMNHQELIAILLHEKYHLTHKDGLTLLIASITESFFPFMPLIFDLLRGYRIDREIQADKEAVAIQGSNSPILQVLKKMISSSSQASIAFSSIADLETLEPRIKTLIQGKSNFNSIKSQNIFVSLLSVLILFLFALTPVEASKGSVTNIEVSCKSNIIPYFSYPAHEDNVSRMYSPAH